MSSTTAEDQKPVVNGAADASASTDNTATEQQAADGVAKTETAAPAANGKSSDAPAASSTQASGGSAPAPSSSSSAQQQASGNTTSLYVGELDSNITEAMLFEIFNMIGPVASIRVCRDAVTRRSLGYAYVNFISASDGEKALEQLNYSLIRGRPCRIMFSQRDPALRRTGQGNIFIKNLDEAIDNKALHDTFAAFGKILSCKVAIGENGSLGYGFVHYETAEAADAAIQHVNGMLLNDKKVYVGHHMPKKERLAKIEEARSRFTNVYVKNVELTVTQEQFEELFKKYGEITSIILAHDDDGKSKGFGFVNYVDHDAAQKAVDELNDSDFNGQKLFVARAQKKGEREQELRRSYEAAKNERLSQYQGTNLYLKNIPEEFDDERLREEFAPFGTITSAKVMRSSNGVSRGFGFVCYSAPDEANKAVTEMNGKMLDNKPLYVALAQRKDVRRQQLEAQMMQRNQLRLQQQATQGMAYGTTPGMYYTQPFPGQPGPGGMPGRPRYAPAGMMPQGMPMAGPYGQPAPGQFPGAVMPQGYGRPPRPPRGAAGPSGAPPGARPVNGAAGAGARPPMPGQLPRPGGPGARPAGRAAGAASGAAGASAPATGPAVLNPAALASAGPEEQKQILGEAIYPQIQATQGDLAGKLTGMILELPVSELLHLLEDKAALDSKVDEALHVLREFEQSETAPAAAEPTAA
ncbi:polyadenylate binding protein [Tilletiaria anomala UBC 951]|uniref:Polyadenylate-binding protein n=1 Tax=Tilletiaria anomala (strain ATCC 24038 / CBS 436.72 / UBC 951) TaxID=1037660 RepID=A0A066WPG7_TILAU|nr:polyadenylate binding protein [Tilletiaria anomala UBC 951]KDN52520.1 polyadenylate binding protein [Tilletiaria anomala UBC 951]